MIQKIKEFISTAYHRFVGYPRAVKSFNFKILSDAETINEIVEKKLSISRFGDGEYGMMMGGEIGFQKHNSECVRRMKEILSSQSPGHLNCIPLAFLDVDNMVRRSKIYLQCYVSGRAKAIKELTPDSSDGRTYGSQGITRFYADFKDKTADTMAAKVAGLKSIWNKRDVYFVEGQYTRCGVGNDLFDNANSIHRIICPSTNAFEKYTDIIDAVDTHVPKNENILVLCALGPTATVLAYDLSKMGYQAIDLGHVDIEYEWYLAGAPYKQQVSGKAVNERGANNPQEEIIDKKYLDEIVANVG